MSSLLEHKQIIHIATEVVVLIGITFYFSLKNKKLQEHMEDLSHRLEEQEDIIQKHDQIIKQLVSTQSISIAPKSTKKQQQRTVEPHKKVNFAPTVTQKEESSSEEDSDLDDEIAAELDELKQQQ